MIEPFDDTAPTGDELTDYDRSHVKLYMRLFEPMPTVLIGARWSKFSSGSTRQRSRTALDMPTTPTWRGRAG